MQTLYVWTLNRNTGMVIKEAVTDYEVVHRHYRHPNQKTYKYTSSYRYYGTTYIEDKNLDRYFQNQTASFTNDDEKALKIINVGVFNRLKKQNELLQKNIEVYHKFLEQNGLEVNNEFSKQMD